MGIRPEIRKPSNCKASRPVQIRSDNEMITFPPRRHHFKRSGGFGVRMLSASVKICFKSPSLWRKSSADGGLFCVRMVISVNPSAWAFTPASGGQSFQRNRGTDAGVIKFRVLFACNRILDYPLNGQNSFLPDDKKCSIMIPGGNRSVARKNVIQLHQKTKMIAKAKCRILQ